MNVCQKLRNKIKQIINSSFRREIKDSFLNKTTPISRVFGFDRGKPIDRYYIEKFLQQNASYIQGVVLEVAGDKYSKQFAQQPITQEILHFDASNPKATIIGDLTKKETLPANKIDCFICTQTLNFIYDVTSALQGARYLLKENGIFLATVAGLSQISRYDANRWGDYWRFTHQSLEKMAKDAGFSSIKVVSFGNAASATAFIQGLAQEDIRHLNILDDIDEDYQIILGLVAVK